MDEKIPFCYFGSHRDTGADPRGGGTSDLEREHKD